MIAEVVFNLPLERAFHYAIPPGLEAAVQRGVRVAAPFGPRERIGFVTGLVARSPLRELKAIRRVIDPLPVIADERWELAAWLSSYYYCSLGEALSLMVPSALRVKSAVPESAEAEAPANGSLTLTPAQEQGMRTILQALEQPASQTVLLHGVTGSGKTELYLRAIDRVLRQGRSAIMLIPEIALTPQTIDRFQERFGDRVAVWHSRLAASRRAATWSRLASGACRIVVGARSAIFAPVPRLGLIVLDEEHEPTYKQEDAPHMHAREVAFARARFAGAAVILGSATPSIESYYEATQRGHHLITLPERVEGRAMPRVELIDMREELTGRHRQGPLSMRLQRAVQGVVERGEQAMLFLNRRGFARVAQCQTCGQTVRCERCSVPLIYHAGEQVLICHYCNARQPPGEICGACKKGYLRFRGAGTERVESELHRLFPVASIARMDRDTTKSRESHRKIYDAVKSEQVGLLVGTQMIAKGLDFPHVTLVGVVSADTALNLPDFRAGERTFSLLTQVAGRAGRGSQPGQVLIQTYCPAHYAIEAAKHHDYARFYQHEIAMRRRLLLPPFVRLIELMLSGSSRERVYAAGTELAKRLQRAAKGQRITLLGPAPHRVPRLRGVYRVCVLMKGKAVESMVEVIRNTLEPNRRFRGMPVSVNVDPR